MTIGKLLVYDSEINQIKDSVLSLFNRGKIKNFYSKYEGQITLAKRKINTLQDEYFIFENGQIKFEGEGSERKPVLKDGKLIETYNLEYNKIVNIPIVIEA